MASLTVSHCSSRWWERCSPYMQLRFPPPVFTECLWFRLYCLNVCDRHDIVLRPVGFSPLADHARIAYRHGGIQKRIWTHGEFPSSSDAYWMLPWLWRRIWTHRESPTRVLFYFESARRTHISLTHMYMRMRLLHMLKKFRGDSITARSVDTWFLTEHVLTRILCLLGKHRRRAFNLDTCGPWTNAPVQVPPISVAHRNCVGYLPSYRQLAHFLWGKTKDSQKFWWSFPCFWDCHDRQADRFPWTSIHRYPSTRLNMLIFCAGKIDCDPRKKRKGFSIRNVTEILSNISYMFYPLN